MKEGLIGLGKSVFATLPPKAIVAVLGIAAELAAPYLACKTADPATLQISQVIIGVIVVAVFFVKFQNPQA